MALLIKIENDGIGQLWVKLSREDLNWIFSH